MKSLNIKIIYKTNEENFLKLTKQGASVTAWAARWSRFDPADHFIFGPFPKISFNNKLVKTPFSSFELKIIFVFN